MTSGAKNCTPYLSQHSDILKYIRSHTEKGLNCQKTLNLWLTRFKQKYPTGVISEREIQKVYKDFFGEKAYIELSNRVLDNYAGNFDSLNLKEFMAALCQASPGDIGLTVLAFRMFDKNCDGVIERAEVNRIARRHYTRKGHEHLRINRLASAFERRLFSLLDPNRSDKITLDHYNNQVLNYSKNSSLTIDQRISVQSDMFMFHWHVTSLLAIANVVQDQSTGGLISAAPCDEPTQFDAFRQRKRETPQLESCIHSEQTMLADVGVLDDASNIYESTIALSYCSELTALEDSLSTAAGLSDITSATEEFAASGGKTDQVNEGLLSNGGSNDVCKGEEKLLEILQREQHNLANGSAGQLEEEDDVLSVSVL